MKFFLPVFALIVVFTYTSCKKDDVLPLNTGIGKNTFGCLVNGKLLIAKKKSMWQLVEDLSIDMYPVNGNWILNIYGGDYTQDTIPSVGLFLHYDELQEGGTYRMQGFQERVTSAVYTFIDIEKNHDFIDYNTNGQLDGEIKITTLNKDERIISGTFWFDGVNKNGETVQIRDGRFDVKY